MKESIVDRNFGMFFSFLGGLGGNRQRLFYALGSGIIHNRDEKVAQN